MAQERPKKLASLNFEAARAKVMHMDTFIDSFSEEAWNESKEKKANCLVLG